MVRRSTFCKIMFLNPPTSNNILMAFTHLIALMFSALVDSGDRLVWRCFSKIGGYVFQTDRKQINNSNMNTKGRADSMFAPSQWETVLLCNDVSHWLGANPESALKGHYTTLEFHKWISVIGGNVIFSGKNKLARYRWWGAVIMSNTNDTFGLTLGLRPANQRQRYFVTTSAFGRVQA